MMFAYIDDEPEDETCPFCGEMLERGSCFNRECDRGAANIASDRGDYECHFLADEGRI
jgi:hypothetical protein